ncbi:MAG: FKBP-type peptidyl-prolyl cis-trans isomerase [Pirellulaceae bacterium]
MARSRIRQHCDKSLNFQQLEPRQMLAGDVTVVVDMGQLIITGDGEANQIEVTGTRRGSATVTGLNGTTINGSDSPFRALTPGLRGAEIDLGGGDDEATIRGARLMQGMTVDGGAGNDGIFVDNSSLRGNLQIDAGEGNNVVEIDRVFVVGNSEIRSGGGNDFVSILAHAVIGSLTIDTGAGSDVLAVDNVGVLGSANVDMGADNDQVLIAGRTYAGGGSSIMLGSGEDFLGVLPEQRGTTADLNSGIRVDAGPDADYVVLGAGVSLSGGSLVAGGAASDTLDYHPSTGLGPGNISGFENINTGHYDQILGGLYNYLKSGGLEPSAFGLVPLVQPPVEIEVANSELTHTETDAPVTIDPSIQIQVQGSNSGTIDNGTIEISSGFVQGQDYLNFTPVAGITAEIDDQNGVLKLTGSAPVADYEALLRSVRYLNGLTGEDFVAGERVISFQVSSDGESAFDQRTVDVQAASEERLITNYLFNNNLTAERTASGLYYIINQEGDGTFPSLNNEVTVNYEGRLLADGSVFDDGTNFTRPLASLIPGWQEGVPLISKGGSATLLIPSALGYRGNARPGIPPNSILIFEIELLDFN